MGPDFDLPFVAVLDSVIDKVSISKTNYKVTLVNLLLVPCFTSALG